MAVMARVECGLVMSHSPLIMINREAAGERGARFLQAADDMRSWLDRKNIDVMILIADDHWYSYFYDHMPTFLIGTDQCEGWGDWDLPKYRIPVEKDLASHLLHAGLTKGFDLSFSRSMKIDHGHTQIMYFLNPDLRIPVVPIAINTIAPPLPTLKRSFELGEMIKEAVVEWEKDTRVAVIGSGGLSHWVPIPKLDSQKEQDQAMIQVMLHGRSVIDDSDQYNEMRKKRFQNVKSGRVNEEWDRKILDMIVNGQHDQLKSMTAEEIEKEGGGGGQEIRNWVAVMGAVQGLKAEVVCYQPVPEWVTGMGIVRWE